MTETDPPESEPSELEPEENDGLAGACLCHDAAVCPDDR